MRSEVYRTIVLVFLSQASSYGQLPQRSTLVSDLAKMPGQIQDGSFDQIAFEDSIEAAVGDQSLAFSKLNPLLELDLKNSDVRVRRYAVLAVSQLSSRRPNSLEELRPIVPAIVSSVDDSDRGIRMGSIVAAAGLHPTVPDTVIIPLRERLLRDDANRESSAILAGVLTKLRPHDPATDAAVISFLKNAKLSDGLKAEVLQEIGAPSLSDSITMQITEMLAHAQSEQIKMASLVASEKIGPRALNVEKETLTAIQADQTKSPSLRRESSRALGLLNK